MALRKDMGVLSYALLDQQVRWETLSKETSKQQTG